MSAKKRKATRKPHHYGRNSKRTLKGALRRMDARPMADERERLRHDEREHFAMLDGVAEPCGP